MIYESVITLNQQTKVVMVDNKHESLHGKYLLIVTPGPYHIFRCIDEGLVYFVSRDYHGESMIFSIEDENIGYISQPNSTGRKLYHKEIFPETTSFKSILARLNDSEEGQ